jgi:two-component system, LytTR family, response regulator
LNNPIRCVIVDDEALAREAIRSHIEGDPMLKLVGEAEDGGAAIQAIEELQPDLLFLDIQMPEFDGLEVLRELATKRMRLPVTIFITAHDEYALRAFEAHALDYLLKPIRAERFKDAVAGAKSRITTDRGSQASDRLATLLSGGEFPARWAARLPVKAEGRIVLVRVEQIEWIESEGNYVRLHLRGQSHLLRDTMSAIEAKLDPAQFTRIHRCAIVNINSIEHLRPWFTGEYIVRMQSGKELTLTRSYRDNLHRLLGKNEI